MSDELSVVGPASSGSREQISAASNWFSWSDWVGLVASIGCAVHCAAMPFVIAYLPVLGLSFLADETFHQWMAIACFAIAVTAFIPGLRKHGRLTPVILGSVGLVMISFAAFGLAGECCAACENEAMPIASSSDECCSEACCPDCASAGVAASASDISDAPESLVDGSSGSMPWLGLIAPWLTPLGGMVLVCAHLLNRRYGCLCGCCSSEIARSSV